MTRKGAPDGTRAQGADRTVAELARRQHGVVAAQQLRALGLTEHQIRSRADAGRLHRCHRGVYAVGHRAVTRHGDWLAAVLACGQGAVLSHHSAAALWGLREDRAAPIDVTVPTRAGRRRPGLAMHRSSTLAPAETTRREGIPVTTPARTLLDLATFLEGRPLERAIDETERLRLCGRDDLAAIAAAHRGQPGAGALAAVLAKHEIGSTLTRSELEERFLALCHARGLPVPLVNAPLLGYTADFFWPAARVLVELDGHASHGTRAAFERDRDRDSRLAAHGFRTLRFTWRDVTVRPAVVAARVRRVLDAQRE